MLQSRQNGDADRQNANPDRKNSDAEFSDGLLSLMPLMRALSRSMCHDASLSEEILQEALCKAWGARATFRRGSNLKAWLLMILRHTYYNDRRRAWRRVALDENMAQSIPGPEDEQVWAVHLADTVEALRVLSVIQRKTLILVGFGGLPYEDVAAICGCPIGTAKSRATRARRKVLAALEGSGKSFRRGWIPIERAANQLMQELDMIVGTHAP